MQNLSHTCSKLPANSKISKNGQKFANLQNLGQLLWHCLRLVRPFRDLSSAAETMSDRCRTRLCRTRFGFWHAFGLKLPTSLTKSISAIKCQNQTKKNLRNPTAAASSLAGGIDKRIFDVSPVNSISKTESALCVSLKQTLYCESHFIQIDRGS